jgi:hypothetical protein
VKASTVALIALGVAGAGAGAFFLLRRRSAIANGGAAMAVAAAPAHPNALQSAESFAGKSLGVPLNTIGTAAQKSPTWLKVAALPVGVTSVAQSFISHPVDTIKAGVAIPAKAISTVASGAKSVVNAVKFW